MKRFLTVFLVCLFLVTALCGTVTVAFADQNDIVLDLDVTKQGDEVVAVVSVEENDGIVDLYLRVEYDTEVLELTEREFGPALRSLGPVDNFDGAEYEYPYRVTYVGDVTNYTDTGRLLTLTFKVKEGAKNGTYPVKLVVRQVGARAGDLSAGTIYNEKYGEQLSVETDPSSTAVGGVIVAEKSVIISGGSVDEIRDPAKESESTNKLIIGLSVGGSVLVVGAVVAAYLIYRKKHSTQITDKQ